MEALYSARSTQQQASAAADARKEGAQQRKGKEGGARREGAQQRKARLAREAVAMENEIESRADALCEAEAAFHVCNEFANRPSVIRDHGTRPPPPTPA